MASRDVASNICQARCPPRHRHFCEPWSVELNHAMTWREKCLQGPGGRRRVLHDHHGGPRGDRQRVVVLLLEPAVRTQGAGYLQPGGVVQVDPKLTALTFSA